VAGGSLGCEVDLGVLSSELLDNTNLKTKFTGKSSSGLLIDFEKCGMVIIYRTGNYIIRGGSDRSELDRTKKMWFDLLQREKIINDLSDVDYGITNIVFTGELNQKIDLATLCVELGMHHTEYEPEQFPGLIYRPEDYSEVVLVFSSGKTVITGGIKKENAENVMKHVQKNIEQG
jgi:transcription initiation factor TFIID TATA-box-binding protein